MLDDIELRDAMLGHLASMTFHGNNQVELFAALESTLGPALVQHNRRVTRSIVSAASHERFEVGPRRYKGSIVVCLYGKPEFQFIQNALFSAGRGAEEYEYIYVCNSPELLEALCKAARISQLVYGLNVTVVMLPGNAGFGAANNIAARYARSRRLLIVNPDVFPKNGTWALDHAELIATLPRNQTRLFGCLLFYADGSLMHAGMYLDLDWGISVGGLQIRKHPMLRVEHHGKGAPRNFQAYLTSRWVTAVSGAFISIERSWFEQLNGFSEDYIFGHYEDADLCLRSLERGSPAWVHNIQFWHLEGKGATRLPHHEGASQVNRSLFTTSWYDRVVPQLIGKVAPAIPDAVSAAE